jgi:hypothetical protein
MRFNGFSRVARRSTCGKTGGNAQEMLLCTAMFSVLAFPAMDWR